MKNPSNPFYEIGTRLKIEPIKLFRASSQVGKKYLKNIQGGDIDSFFIGYICERDSFFAYMYKRMKKEAKDNKKTFLAGNIARTGFPILLPKINRWISKSSLPVLIVPVPSRHGVSERFVLELHRMLDKNSRRASKVKEIFNRTNRILEIKRINSWYKRNRAVENLFSLARSEKVNQSAVLLVDDIVTSGSSLRKLAKLLKSRGVKNIAAVSLTTNLFDSFSYK